MIEKRIHLISGPRNISTALMYSFANRLDFTVVDEPLYAYYLTITGKNHPGRKEVLKSQIADLESITQQVFNKSYPTPYLFLKNMAHHLIGVKPEFIADFHNVFLIRNPEELISSFSKIIAKPTLLDIGLEEEAKWFKTSQENGYKATVLDSNEVLKNPEVILRKLCEKLDIPFSNKMLKWPAAARKEDGVWAKYWYKSVHKSTGFAKRKTTEKKVPKHLESLLEQAMPHYETLYQHAIKL